MHHLDYLVTFGDLKLFTHVIYTFVLADRSACSLLSKALAQLLYVKYSTRGVVERPYPECYISTRERQRFN